MLLDARATSSGSGRAATLWFRLLDNTFRHVVWFLLPIVAFTVLGVMQAGKPLELYRSSATLSAISNPLLPSQQAAGTGSQFFESPASTTSRIINERLRTDSFVVRVLDEAGLGGPLDAGALPLETVREHVWARENGNSILQVSAEWDDPTTARQLVLATISQYEAFLNERLASDALESESFYRERLDELVVERDAALDALETYVTSLEPLREGEERSIAEQFELAQLTDEVDALDERVAAAEDEIERSRLIQVQQASEVGRSFTVIDQPTEPSAPQSALVQRVVTVVMYAMLGTLVSIAAIGITTLVQQSVVSARDLIEVDGIDLVATVPVLPATVMGAAATKRRRWRGRRT